MKSSRTISFTANKNASDYSEAYNNFIFANGVGTHGTIDLNTANNFGLYSATNYNLELKSQGTGDITLNADGGNITLKDDTTTISDFQTTQIKNEVPLLIKEAADAVADTAAYGQLWVKTATPNQLYFTTDAGDDIQLTSGTAAAFVGDITGVTAGTNCSGGGSSGDVTFNVDDAFIVNDADDTMAGTLTVDKDVSNTSAGSYFGLDIDYQKTGNSTSDNTLMGLKIDAGNTTATNGTNTMYGIWNRVRLQHDADAGTATTVGSLTSVVASTNGTATAIGTDIVVTGADTNIGLRINNPDGGNDFQILSSANNNDYFQIATTAEGATTLSTVDADTAVGHLTLAPDGDLILDPVSTKVIINATDDLYFDGGTHTYITESSDDVLDIYVGALNIMKLDEANDKVEVLGADLEIDAAKKIYLDGGGDTYIHEASADLAEIYVGGDKMVSLTENGADGNTFDFDGCATGFTRLEATFSATGVIASGGTDDTDIDFRFSNKYRLEMTGDITTINLIFPPVSGNFLLVCTTNGDHDVTNWKAFESDESAATTANVLWAGGSVPAFTDSGKDIVSFYWDSTEQE